MPSSGSIPPESTPGIFSSAFHFGLRRCFVVFVLIGLLGVIGGLGWEHWGMSICLAGGSVASGALLGFLFGVPRVLQQKPGSDGQDAAPMTASNTNLERISDWLTAIIIGVSLVQLTEIGESLDGLARQVSGEVGDDQGAGYTAVYFGVLYFGIGGFLFTYLFTRIQLVRAFTETERKLRDEMSNAATRERLLVDQVARLARDGGSPAGMLKGGEGDQNKGRFGGSPSVKGRTLGAKVSPIDDSDWCSVALWVTGSADKPLSGRVSFHLHQTFKPHDVVEVTAVDNEARCTVVAWGAFTVGAVCDGGRTRLELDLADGASGGPEEWLER